jgi:hypothetical protein
MKALSFVRFATYAMLLAIALLNSSTRRFIEVRLQPDETPPRINPTDIATWHGQKEKWIVAALVEAQRFSDKTISAPYPEVPIGIKSLLEEKAPGYSGSIRLVRWVQNAPGFIGRTYLVYMYLDGRDWLVLDVATWEDQYEA